MNKQTSEDFLERVNSVAIRDHFQKSLSHNWIWPSFQPIVEIRTHALAGFEILARWSDPEWGEISPDLFIPHLEKLDLLNPLLEHLLHHACTASAAWPGAIFLAFNVSPNQLVSKGFSQLIARTAHSAGFLPNRIQIEVTEGALIEDADHTFDVLREMDDLGFPIVIDDFGTGYSSLARLETFPFRKLKIDKRFVRSLDGDAGKRRIAAAIIGLGQSLGINVVAEGVETEAEEKILRGFGCNLGQGWLYGRSVRAKEAQAMLSLYGQARVQRKALDSSPFQQLHQLAILYEQAPVGLAFLDIELRHVRGNHRYADMHGLTEEGLEGARIFEIMSGDTLQRISSLLREALLSGQSVPEQFLLREREYTIFCARVTDVGNEVLGFSVVAIDITEQNKLLRAFVESEDHFRRVIDLNPEISWAASPDGVVDYISPTPEDQVGDTMQVRIDRWMGQMHTEDRARVRGEWLAWIPRELPFETEFRLHDRNGEYRWVRSRATPFRNSEGHIDRWYGLISDITELKLLQERVWGREEIRE